MIQETCLCQSGHQHLHPGSASYFGRPSIIMHATSRSCHASTTYIYMYFLSFLYLLFSSTIRHPSTFLHLCTSIRTAHTDLQPIIIIIIIFIIVPGLAPRPPVYGSDAARSTMRLRCIMLASIDVHRPRAWALSNFLSNIAFPVYHAAFKVQLVRGTPPGLAGEYKTFHSSSACLFVLLVNGTLHSILGVNSSHPPR